MGICHWALIIVSLAITSHRSQIYQTQVVKDINERILNRTLEETLNNQIQQKVLDTVAPILIEESHSHILAEFVYSLNLTEASLIEAQSRISNRIQECNYTYINTKQQRINLQWSETFVEEALPGLCHMSLNHIHDIWKEKYHNICESVALVSPDANSNIRTTKHISIYYDLQSELMHLYKAVKNADVVAFHSVLDDISIVYPSLDTPFISDSYKYRKDLYQQHVLQLSPVRQHFEADTILMILDGSELLSTQMINEIKLLSSIYASSISLNVQLKIVFAAYEVIYINEGTHEPLVTSLDSILKNIQDFDPVVSKLGYYVSMRTLIDTISDSATDAGVNRTLAVVYIGHGIVRDTTPDLSDIKDLQLYTVFIANTLAEKAYGKTKATNLKKHLIDFTRLVNGYTQYMDYASLSYTNEILREIDELDDLVRTYEILSNRCSKEFYNCLKRSNYTSVHWADKDTRKKQSRIIEKCKANLSPSEGAKLTNCINPSLLSTDYDLPFNSNSQDNALLNKYRHKLLLESAFLRPNNYNIKLSLSESGWLINDTILIMSTPVYAELPFYGRRLAGFLSIGITNLTSTANTNALTFLNIDNYKIVWPGFRLLQDERLLYFSSLNQRAAKYITEYGFYRTDMVNLKELIDIQIERSVLDYSEILDILRSASIMSVKIPNVLTNSESNSIIILTNEDFKHVCLKNRFCSKPDARVGIYDIVIYNKKYRAEEYPRSLFRVRIVILENYDLATHGLVERFQIETMSHPFYSYPNSYHPSIESSALQRWLDALINGKNYDSLYAIDPCITFSSIFCTVKALKVYITNEYFGLKTTASPIVTPCVYPLVGFYDIVSKIYTPATGQTVSRPEKNYIYALIYPPSRQKQLCGSWYANLTTQKYLIQYLGNVPYPPPNPSPCCFKSVEPAHLQQIELCFFEFSIPFWKVAQNSYRIMVSILDEFIKTWVMDSVKKSYHPGLEALLSQAYYLPPTQILVFLDESVGVFLATHYVNLSYTELLYSVQDRFPILMSKLCRNTSLIPSLSIYTENDINKFFTYIAYTSNILIDIPHYRAQPFFRFVILERVDLVEDRIDAILYPSYSQVKSPTETFLALVLNTHGVAVASSHSSYPPLTRLDEGVKLRIIASILHHNKVLQIYENTNFEYVVLPLAELRYKRQKHMLEQCVSSTQWENSTYTVRSELEERSLKNMATNPFFVKDRAYNEEIFIRLASPSIFIDGVQVQHLNSPDTVYGSCTMGSLGSLITLYCIGLDSSISTQILWERIVLNRSNYLNTSQMPTTDWYYVALPTFKVESNFDWFFRPQKSIWKEFQYIQSPLWQPETGYNDPIKNYCIDLISSQNVYGYSVSFLRSQVLFIPPFSVEAILIIISMTIAGICVLVYTVSCLYSCVSMTKY